jgi:hypothetical protein
MKTTTPRLFSATRHAGNFFLATLFMLLAARDASAQSTYYWVGRDTSPTFFGAYWSYNNNFSTSSGGGGLGSTIPSLQNYLNFDGAAVGGYTSTNDFAAGSGGFQIYFKSGASAYNLYGNSITFYNFNVSGTPTDPNIQNEGATVQTINFPIVDGNSSGANGILNININPGGAGPLVFNGSLSALDAAIATRAINISNTAAITFNGVISDFSSSGKIGRQHDHAGGHQHLQRTDDAGFRRHVKHQQRHGARHGHAGLERQRDQRQHQRGGDHLGQ